ncbi:MAG: class I SAM-dependent methyltransferase [Acidimicrobiales bacterium]
MQQRGEGLGATGFKDGTLYDSARPDYPDAAINYFVSVFDLGARSSALDLGAGTGIFTRQMLPHVGAMIAVDPSESMRDTLRETTSDVVVLDGSDINIPVPDECVDVAFVAQAFHWFDETRALEEIRRVLVATGGLGLIWNERDESVDWVRALSHAMQWDTKQPYEVGRDFTAVISSGPFTDVERVTFPHAQTLSRDVLYKRVLSTSYISTMEMRERELLMKRVGEVVEELVEPIVLPYVTTAYSARAD